VSDAMSFAVEVLLEPSVADSYGKTVPVPHTRLRYDVRLSQWEDDGVSYPYVANERVTPILATNDEWVGRHQVSEAFRSSFLRYAHSAPLLETVEAPDGEPLFILVEESAGNRRLEIPTEAAEATALSSITTAAGHPSLYALKREMQSWRFLDPEPSALRQPSPRGRPAPLAADGVNLAQVLHRIERETSDDTGSFLDEIAADLTRIVRGVVGIEVAEDRARKEWEIYLRMRPEGRISARIASDGTLRVLALLAALYDPVGGGLICFEEPENGIYPQKLRDLLQQLRSLVTNPRDDTQGYPMKQLLLTSHSPVLLSELPAEQLVIFDWVTRIVGATGERSRVTRARWIRAPQPEPVPLEEVGRYVSEAERDTMIGVDHARKLLA